METTMEEMIRAMKGPLGTEMAKIARMYIAPLVWKELTPHTKDVHLRNGTCFFLDGTNGPFGITAGHVYDGYISKPVTKARIGVSKLNFDLKERLISRGKRCDIATFRITRDEIKTTGAEVLTGIQKEWPPLPPQTGRGVIFAGFPGVDRSILENRTIEFVPYTYLGIASSVSDTDVSCLIEREHGISMEGMLDTPVGFDFGGISGAPLITMVQGEVSGWRLAGVVYESSRMFELLKAVRADHIRLDGTLAN